MLCSSVPAQLSAIITSGSMILFEGGNVSVFCSAYNAYPEVNVAWLKWNTNGTTKLSNWLNFTNIGRSASEDYICIAKNTCGKRNSSRTFIDVQCKGSTLIRCPFIKHLTIRQLAYSDMSVKII